MSAITLNIFLFAAAVIAFAVFGFTALRRHKSVKDYFHDNSLFKNVVSLSATDITLGTGLVYLVTGAQHNGLLMLITPFMLYLGYYLQGEFIEKATHISLRTGKNLIASIDDQISALTSRRSPFANIVSGSLVVVFVLVLAFEIFASSKVIAPFLFKTPGVSPEIWLSVIIFVITVLYTLLGGIGAVFRVDALQVPLILLFLPAFVVVTIFDIRSPEQLINRLPTILKFDGVTIAAVVIVSINSIATQFYSLLNWGAVSHLEPSNQKRMLRWVGLTSAIVLSVFVVVGLLHPVEPGKPVWVDITEKFSLLVGQENLRAYLLSGLLVLGMASILLTTTDAVVITTIMFWYDNIIKGNSKNTVHDPRELRKIRRIGALTFSLCFGVLMVLNYFQPDPFYLLLSMAGGVVVFAPMIATAGYLSSRGQSLRIFKPSVVYTYFALFLLSGILNISMLAYKSPLVGYIGVFAFALSSLFSLFLILRTQK